MSLNKDIVVELMHAQILGGGVDEKIYNDEDINMMVVVTNNAVCSGSPVEGGKDITRIVLSLIFILRLSR
jgi:hypothetical protein